MLCCRDRCRCCHPTAATRHAHTTGQLRAGRCSAGVVTATAAAATGTAARHVSARYHTLHLLSTSAASNYGTPSANSHAMCVSLCCLCCVLPPRCLEVGCGSGFVICSVALALQHLHSLQLVAAAVSGSQAAPGADRAAGGAGEDATKPHTAASPCSFTAVDISPAALEATAATLKAHGVRAGFLGV